ncbi:hypothetical protein [Inquilinus limosus]|nr:hypothetical protein [Inquilinus limosus]
MRRSFVFTALAVSAFAAAPALAQTGVEPATPGTAPSVEAPAANAPAEQPAPSTHRHRKHMQSSNADDQAQPRHRRGSKNSAEEEQTRQLNQQQLSAGATPTAPGAAMPGTAMPGQMAPAEPMQPGGMMEQAPSTDQTVPAEPMAPTGE